jgi:hypothetical protein
MKIVERPTIKNEKQLRAFTKKWVPWWRDRLGLRDWHIDVETCGSSDLEDAYADCTPEFPKRTARIRFLAPSARDEIWEKHDIEETIVHEMLHIIFGTAGVGLGEYESQKMSPAVLVEQQINALAHALVTLKRGTWR